MTKAEKRNVYVMVKPYYIATSRVLKIGGPLEGWSDSRALDSEPE